MRSFWRGCGDMVRKVVYALIGQPSRPGPTAQERWNRADRQQESAERLARPATFWDAARQVSGEVFRAVIWQPSGRAPRKKR